MRTITFNNYVFLNVSGVCYVNAAAGYGFDEFSTIVNLQNNAVVQNAADEDALHMQALASSDVQKQLANMYAGALAA